MNRGRAAADTGADLVWRVKNGVRSRPVDHPRSRPRWEGSVLVVLRDHLTPPCQAGQCPDPRPHLSLPTATANEK
ncbi:MAG: hypothetical protein QG671_2900 [Actinomycetota bacterium]|nr:hypothetical protein [Actinomycetota bacterium]